MEGRITALATQTTSEVTKIDITGTNYYRTALQNLYLKEKNPSPEQALRVVMQQYLDGNHPNHKTDATDIKAMLDKDQLKDALIHLSTIKMNLAGDSAQALATFFNLFPQLMHFDMGPAFELSLGQDAWQTDIRTWLTSYMAAHEAGKGSNNHEYLEIVAANLPKDKADAFADFLDLSAPGGFFC